MADSEDFTQRQFLETLMASAPVGIAVVGGARHEILLINPTALDLLGFKKEDKPPEKIEQLTRMTDLCNANGMPIPPENWPVQRALGGEMVRNETISLCRKGGESLRWLSVTAAPIRTSQQDGLGAIVSLHDITRERNLGLQRMELIKAIHAEHSKLEAIIESLPEGIVVTDEKARITKTNVASQILFGYPVPYGKIYQSHAMLNLYHPDGTPHDPRQLPLVRSALDGECHGDKEFLLVRPDGKHRAILVNTAPILDDAGNIKGAVGVFRDVTQRKENENKLRQTHRQLSDYAQKLTEANEELSQYAHVVSHDLQGPLRAIRNYVDFLQEDLQENLASEQVGYIDGIRAAIRQGENLINDLLELSKIGRHVQEPVIIDLFRLIEQIEAELNLSDRVHIRMTGPRLFLKAQRLIVWQIFYNLVLNAVTFNHAVRKHILIGSEIHPDHVEIFVRDNGIGVARQYHEMIFKMFQRLHTQKEHEGSGVGLAIVKKAITILGGSIRIESAPAKGSTFHIRLPREILVVSDAIYRTDSDRS